MRRNRARIAFLGGIVSLVLMGTLSAQEHRWEISPEAGYLFGGSVVSDRDEAGKKVTGSLENAGVYGLRAAYLTSPNVEVEIEAARTDARFNLTRASGVEQSSFRTDYLIGSGGYRFKVLDAEDSIARVSLGAGAARLETGGVSPTTRFTAAAGAGFVRYLYPRLGFRIDGRVFASRLDGVNLGTSCAIVFPSGPPEEFPRPCKERSWLINADVTAGLAFGF